MKTDDHSNKRVDIFIEDMINLEKQLDAFRLANTIVNILLVGRAPKIILVTGVLGILFLVYYSFVATPSNFTSLSSTFWYFIPALALLLSIAVIFNNIIMSNELKAMPSDVQTAIDQMNKIMKLVEPIGPEFFNQASRSSTLALYHMIRAAVNAAKDEDKGERILRSICIDFINMSDYILKLFSRTKNPFTLAMMPTADFVIRTLAAFNLKFPLKDDKKPKFLQILLELHVLRSLLARIYIRQSVAALSNDMLISVIPIMSFIAALSSFNAFSDLGMLRFLFSAGLAIVFLPFILLVIRAILIVHLARNNSSIPFPYI